MEWKVDLRRSVEVIATKTQTTELHANLFDAGAEATDGHDDSLVLFEPCAMPMSGG